MITIGLTGNVASGKTMVADRWREAGVRVIDADRLGHVVLVEDDQARRALARAFGKEVVNAEGAIDRAALGDRAFASQAATARLNAIVHPPLLERLRREMKSADEAGVEWIVIDAALIFEFGMDRDLDRIVLVTAPAGLREKRLQEARGLDSEQIARIMASQQPDDGKANSSDYVIVNDGTMAELLAQADAVLARLRDDIEKGAGS